MDFSILTLGTSQDCNIVYTLCFLIDFSCFLDLAHFTDSSTGSLVTLDRKSGVVEWKIQIGSPIVALYRVEGDGIVNVPFTSVSKETLGNLMEQFDLPGSANEIIGETKLL